MKRQVNGKVRRIRRLRKMRQERDLSVLNQLIGLTALLIVFMGILYITDVVRNRWTLVLIIVMGAAMNLSLLLEASVKKQWKKQQMKKD